MCGSAHHPRKWAAAVLLSSPVPAPRGMRPPHRCAKVPPGKALGAADGWTNQRWCDLTWRDVYRTMPAGKTQTAWRAFCPHPLRRRSPQSCEFRRTRADGSVTAVIRCARAALARAPVSARSRFIPKADVAILNLTKSTLRAEHVGNVGSRVEVLVRLEREDAIGSTIS